MYGPRVPLAETPRDTYGLVPEPPPPETVEPTDTRYPQRPRARQRRQREAQELDQQAAAGARQTQLEGVSDWLGRLGFGGLSKLAGIGGQAAGLAAGGEAAQAGTAAGGLPGLGLAAAQQVGKMAASGIRAGGDLATGAAKLDVGALADGFEGLVKNIPIFGDAIAEASGALRKFFDALDETSKKLAPYSGELAVAQAQTELAQIQGDMRRAQLLGGDLAHFTEARSRLSQTGQDVMADLLRPLLPLATSAVEMLTSILETLSAVIKGLEQFFGGGQVWAAINEQLRAIERNTQPANENQFQDWGQLISATLSDDVRRRTAAGLPGRDDGGRRRGPNFPLLGGS
jgi:hypothetical protein